MVVWQGSMFVIFLGREGETVVRWEAQGAEKRKLVERNRWGLPSEETATQTWAVVGAWGGTDRSTEGGLPLVNSIWNTPKLSAYIWHMEAHLAYHWYICALIKKTNFEKQQFLCKDDVTWWDISECEAPWGTNLAASTIWPSWTSTPGSRNRTIMCKARPSCGGQS